MDDHGTAQTPERAVAPALAALLLAGAGHFSVGRYRRGIAWFVFETLCFLSAVGVILAGATNLLWLFLFVGLTARIAAAVDLQRLRRTQPMSGPFPHWGKVILLWILLLVVSRLSSLSVRATLTEAFKIPGGSMSPTLLVGDHIFVSKVFGKPKRGDVVVFKWPEDPQKDFVMRIIAVGGDTVESKGRDLLVNGRSVERKHVDQDCQYEDLTDEGKWERRACDGWQEKQDGATYTIVFERRPKSPDRAVAPVTVPASAVYVMGDNRDNAYDSRFWGTVPVENIKGKAVSIWFSDGETGPRWPRMGMRVQ